MVDPTHCRLNSGPKLERAQNSRLIALLGTRQNRRRQRIIRNVCVHQGGQNINTWGLGGYTERLTAWWVGEVVDHMQGPPDSWHGGGTTGSHRFIVWWTGGESARLIAWWRGGGVRQTHGRGGGGPQGPIDS